MSASKPESLKGEYKNNKNEKMTLKTFVFGGKILLLCCRGVFLLRKGPENVSGNHTNNDKNSC